mgnify:CR=1 FL=1|tara:strand:+ start:625 stop:1038 length:414 start_codon:yes stop_codon:yes gene_type:complete
MATFNKFQAFVENLAEGKHDFSADQLRVALCDSEPTVGMVALSELSEVSYTNLSGANPLNLTTSSSSQTAGVYNLVLADLTLTATGVVGPFQWVAVYNTVPTGYELIGWAERSAAVTMQSGDEFVVDFDAAGLFSIT